MWKRRSAANSPNASTAIGTINTASYRGRTSAGYRGRFAPSPTGPLHLGSLVAATASYLQALAAGGEWLVRIEDIDPPREAPGAGDQILRSLQAHGFRWTGAVRRQSRRQAAHLAAIDALEQAGLAFHCDCSRREIRANARTGAIGPVYPGTCRHKQPGAVARRHSAIRVAVAPTLIEFTDGLQGRRCWRLDRDIGAFVIRRRDGLIAYALAATVDDHAQGITEVVRGTDLQAMTPAQMWLQRLLDLDQPAYLHVPIVRNRAGRKLSKQTGAASLVDAAPGQNLCDALSHLGQSPPAELRGEPPEVIWDWAASRWDPRLAGVDGGQHAPPKN